MSFVLILLACLLEGMAAGNVPVKINLVAAGLCVYFLSLLLSGVGVH